MKIDRQRILRQQEETERLIARLKAPRCPSCGRKMMDDADSMTGGWLCAYNHRAVVIPIP